MKGGSETKTINFKTLWPLCALWLMMLFTGCELYDFYEQDEYEEQYFVYSQLTALEPLPRVELYTTTPFDTEFIRDERRAGGGKVAIHLMDAQGDREETYEYTELSDGRHRYRSDEPVPVLPMRTYELEITLPGSGEKMTSHTTVPDTFRVAQAVRDSVTYLQDDLLEFEVTKSAYPGRESYYMLATKALDRDNYGLTPYYEESTLHRNGLLHIRTPIMNEASFESQNNRLQILFPWENIAHYGPNEFIVRTIDDNMHDFYLTLDSQTGNDHLSPGEMRNIKYNIEGGIGLFGSMATAKAEGFVENNRK
ncbi:MAG: DUF4249 family protein [Balneolales bacterium]